MSATDEQLAGREGAIRHAAETLIGEGYHRASGNPTPICADVKFLIAVLDGERLRIQQLKDEVKELLETRGDMERQLQDFSRVTADFEALKTLVRNIEPWASHHACNNRSVSELADKVYQDCVASRRLTK